MANDLSDDINSSDSPPQLFSMEKNCTRDEVIFTQGENSREMYILLEGKVTVAVEGMELAVIGTKGSYFGEMAKLLDMPRTATVRALAPCKLLVIQEDVVEEFLSHSPNLGFKLAKILAGRLKETTNDLVEMSQLVVMGHKVSGKVYSRLNRFKEESSGVNKVYGEVHKALQVYGQKSKQAVVNVTRKGAAADAAAEMEDKIRQILYSVDHKCFFHKSDDIIKCHSLKVKTQVVHPNAFDVMVYKAAVPEQVYCNYMLIEVQVCPKCYFATNFYKHLCSERSDSKERPKEFNGAVVAQMAATKNERKAIFDKMSGDVLAGGFQRSYEDAILSFELAAMSYKTVALAHKVPHGMSLYRVGNFYLKAAQLCAETNDLDRGDGYLEQALNYLEKSYTTLSGPSLFRVSLQIFALSVYFEDFQNAEQYMQAMTKLSSEPIDNPKDKMVLKKYLSRMKEYWQDREDFTRTVLRAKAKA